MDINALTALISAILAVASTAVTLYLSLKRFKPEVKKLEVEVDSELVEASNLNLEGAKISAQMLLDRINELKGELDAEKKYRRESLEQSEKSHKESMAAMEKANTEAIAALEKARKIDADYFRRRIRDLEKELRAYRVWAGTLSKQVVEAGKIPAPLLLGIDSDTKIQAIRTELEEEDEPTND